MRLRAASATRAASQGGAPGEQNQDHAWLDPAAGWFAVSDGLGAYAGGEVASAVAVEACARALAAPPAGALTPRARLNAAVQEAARALHQRGRRERLLSRMAATLTVLELSPGQWRAAHVGDSRCYLLREGTLRQLTTDHSLAFEQYLAGAIPKDALADHPNQRLLTRTLSATRPFVVPELLEGEARPGDLFLLCSDGLLAGLDDEGLARLLAGGDDPQATCARLVEAASGRDDATALVVAAEW